MTQCPRCGDVVDHLQPLPAESLRTEVRERTTGESATSPKACSWCRHELLEG